MDLILKIAILVGVVSVQAYVLRAMVRRWGGAGVERDPKLWDLAGHLLGGAACARGAGWLLRDQELPLRVTVSLLVFSLVLGGLLTGFEKAQFLRAVLIALLMAGLGIGAAIAAVMAGMI